MTLKSIIITTAIATVATLGAIGSASAGKGLNYPYRTAIADFGKPHVKVGQTKGDRHNSWFNSTPTLNPPVRRAHIVYGDMNISVKAE